MLEAILSICTPYDDNQLTSINVVLHDHNVNNARATDTACILIVIRAGLTLSLIM